jgi:anaerobic selenocysteine-containing dehydrogenase
MGQKRVDRREFLKLEAAAMAAVAGGMPVPVAAQNLITDRSFTELKWNKAPCRFCGTGLSHGRNQRRPGCSDAWRHQGRGQSRTQLRQRVFPPK